MVGSSTYAQAGRVQNGPSCPMANTRRNMTIQTSGPTFSSRIAMTQMPEVVGDQEFKVGPCESGLVYIGKGAYGVVW